MVGILSRFLLGFDLFAGAFAVSFREGIPGHQWLFLVPLKGGRLHITPQLATIEAV